MKEESLKDERPERPAHGYVLLKSAPQTQRMYVSHHGTYVTGGYWNFEDWDIFAGTALSAPTTEPAPAEEGQIVLPSQRTPEAELFETKMRSLVSGILRGTTVHTTPPSVDVGAVFAKHTEQKLGEICERLGRLESGLEEAVKGIERLRTQDHTIWVPINSLAPEPYELLRPITAVVTPVGDEFEASFFDANLYGSGDTEEEAISDLKTVIIEAFQRLSALQDGQLGPAMLKQKLVLGTHVRVRKGKE